MTTGRTEFLGVGFDRLSAGEVLERLGRVTPATPYGYLVTPNVDHLVRSDRAATPADAALRPIYAAARWCLCDSRILARLARLRGVTLPVVTGSDLTAAIFATLLRPGDRVAVVGGGEAAIARLRDRFPEIDIAHHQPPMGLRDDAAAMAKAAAFAATSGARFIFLAVGCPQQELLARAIGGRREARGLALCVGASIDFIVGAQARAPVALQRLGVEWAYRLASDPRRLWRRYLVEGPRIFVMASRWRRPS